MNHTITAIDIFVAITLLLSAFYYYLTKHFNYWKRYNVAGPSPIPLFGNFKDVILGKINGLDLLESLYNAYPNAPVVGLFFARQPVLLVKDLDTFKDIAIKNFSTFPDRGLNIVKEAEPLCENVMFMKYEEWKIWRRYLAPVFTPGKLKNMFYLVNECAQNFETYLRKAVVEENGIMDCQKITAKYTMNVIGSCVFGLNINTFSDNENEFMKHGRLFFSKIWNSKFIRFLRLCPRWMSSILGPLANNEEVVGFFVDSFKKTMEHRRENNVRRNDIVDLLIDIKNNPEKLNNKDINDVEITAQAFAFFVAGYETSSNTLTHALYELALNPEIQHELREEINSIFKEIDGQLSYEVVKDMQYLDKLLKETLRKYPVIPVLKRKAVCDYMLDQHNILIKKGMVTIMSVYSIHRDPKYYPDPERFDPERFNEEAVRNRHQMSYTPFGEGPRNCIGERFAQIQTKLGLLYLIKNFRFEVCKKTCHTYEKCPNTEVLLLPKNGIYLKISAI